MQRHPLIIANKSELAETLARSAQAYPALTTGWTEPSANVPSQIYSLAALSFQHFLRVISCCKASRFQLSSHEGQAGIPF